MRCNAVASAMGGLEAPSKRTIGVVAVVALAAVAGFLFVVLDDEPTRTQPQEIDEAFSDADVRFSESTTADGHTRTYEFDVEPGHAAITVSTALAFPEEGSWELNNPDGDQLGRIAPRDLDAPLSTLIVHRPNPGTWSMSVTCQGSCSYTLAVDMRDAVSAPGENLRDDVDAHDVVVYVDHDRSASGQESFEVPEGARSVEFATSFYFADGGSFEVTDPGGEEMASWSWSAEWLVREAAYTLDENPRAGTWSISYDCDVGCEIAWGFSFSTPPSG